MATLSFLWSNWQMIIAVVMCLIIAAALAFFLRNWKWALIGAGLIVVYFAGQAIWVDGYETKVAEEVAARTQRLDAEIARLNERASDLNGLAEQHAKRALEAASTITELEAKANETPPNAGACLDVDAARRVRNIR